MRTCYGFYWVGHFLFFSSDGESPLIFSKVKVFSLSNFFYTLFSLGSVQEMKVFRKTTEEGRLFPPLIRSLEVGSLLSPVEPDLQNWRLGLLLHRLYVCSIDDYQLSGMLKYGFVDSV